jgi:hypothetical protein
MLVGVSSALIVPSLLELSHGHHRVVIWRKNPKSRAMRSALIFNFHKRFLQLEHLYTTVRVPSVMSQFLSGIYVALCSKLPLQHTPRLRFLSRQKTNILPRQLEKLPHEVEPTRIVSRAPLILQSSITPQAQRARERTYHSQRTVPPSRSALEPKTTAPQTHPASTPSPYSSSAHLSSASPPPPQQSSPSHPHRSFAATLRGRGQAWTNRH